MGSLANVNAAFFRTLRQDISKEEFQRLITDFVNALPQQVYGTWNPTLRGSVTAGSQTYGTRAGRWTRIGRICFIDFQIVLTAKDVLTSGNMLVSGLPFPAVTSEGNVWPLALSNVDNWDLNVGGARYRMSAHISSGAQLIQLQEMGDNVASAALTEADFADTSSVNGAGWYEVQ